LKLPEGDFSLTKPEWSLMECMWDAVVPHRERRPITAGAVGWTRSYDPDDAPPDGDKGLILL
jgi:hypothetical protein